jgi:hypothetical protein
MASEEMLAGMEVALEDMPGAAAANPRKRASSNMVSSMMVAILQQSQR